MGAITAGLNHVREHGKRWLEASADRRFLKRIMQRLDYSCVYASREMVRAYYGSSSEKYYRTWESDIQSGVDSDKIYRLYHSAEFWKFPYRGGNGNFRNYGTWAVNQILDDRLIIFNFAFQQNGQDFGHSMLLTKIKYTSDNSQFKLYFTDPSNYGLDGTSSFSSSTYFDRLLNSFSVKLKYY
ncbi:MAG: hypothetical protein ACR2MS_01605 [Weeksellaceae bacterium]